MTLGEQDRDRTVAVQPGDTVTVRLRESPTTGYLWEVVEAGGLREQGSRFVPGASPGAGGWREIALLAGQRGESAVVLRQRRPWEESAIAWYRVTVVVG